MKNCAECITLRDALIYRLHEHGAYLQLVNQLTHAYGFPGADDHRLADAQKNSDHAARNMMSAKTALKNHQRSHFELIHQTHRVEDHS
jgi:hypothetical protein